MRLKHLKVSGFKSFADATKISLPSNLVGVVGPNGCGKSNVVDALRWVMGESSAKTLRGDNMDDVIFNGSVSRKPVSKASVELVFDNSSGTAPGPYAKYNEISIKRELLREGGSKYFINGVKSRRKDINDIFMGTGLGPRSYSIIEQGMVSRIVESRPEDLRVLIEEAAGISKYKARRRDTENRMRHTMENLSRVDDIVGELETQLRRLKRQANSAERYKKHKEELRDYQHWLTVLKWSELDEQLQLKRSELTEYETELEKCMADQQGAETGIESLREQQIELTEKVNKVQAKYYELGGEVSALEQQIQHSRESRKQQQSELERIQETQHDSQRLLASDQQRLSEVKAQIDEASPQAEHVMEVHQLSMATLEEAEQKHSDWQESWDLLTNQSMEPERERSHHSGLIDSLRRSIEQASDRQVRTQGLLTEIEGNIDTQAIDELKVAVEEASESSAQMEGQLVSIDADVVSARAEIERLRDDYNAVRQRLQGDTARLKSLQEMRTRSLGADGNLLNQWLSDRGLDKAARLVDGLSVESGWELAIETALGDKLAAYQVDSLEELSQHDLPEGAGVSAFIADKASENDLSKFPSLVGKIKQSVSLPAWIYSAYAAESLDEAFEWQNQLESHETIVTKSGEILSKSWMSMGSPERQSQGLLQQEAEIESLEKTVAVDELQCEKVREKGEFKKAALSDLETARQELRTVFREQSQLLQEKQREYAAIEAKSAEWITRREQLHIELTELTQELSANQGALEVSIEKLELATAAAHEFDQRRVELQRAKEETSSALQDARMVEQSAREAMQNFQATQSNFLNQRDSLEQSVERLTSQLEQQNERLLELQTLMSADDPAEIMSAQLSELLEQRLLVEKELAEERSALSEHENTMRQISQQRSSFDQMVQQVRNKLEQARLSQREIQVKRDGYAENLEDNDEDLRKQAQELSEREIVVTVRMCSEKIESLNIKIDRIGPVNLVAIEEYEECSERAEYLNKQKEDLLSALDTLQKAIAKIDRETRTRFKDTFERLNAGFKQFFPRLFGDGEAYMELTDNDMLSTGVTVMARPPGKKNSTIHLLSGGEKALTAVALIFAFFEMNPAPFCVLDEVDAPMDDANVERYSKVLQQLSQHTQLLYITHNKITMEVAGILVGVTMAEPGCSRIVQVDVEEAAAMAVS
ncbi:MAG: chromosome segregation protein SMC [Arenicella sp.]